MSRKKAVGIRSVRVHEKARTVDMLSVSLEQIDAVPRREQCVVEIRAAAVNPSDVKAMLGLMSHAVFPRTPGRDWAGVVVSGPSDLRGREVWGSGGDFGIRRNGSHATHLVAGRGEISVKPANLSLLEAGAIGVPFITAYEGLRRAGRPKKGEVVVVFGANGKVGQAATQLARMYGAKVFAVVRKKRSCGHCAKRAVRTICADNEDVVRLVLDETGGHGADVIFNTVGSPYFEHANKLMALRGRQILISTVERSVPFDILPFFRGQRTFVGIDTLGFNAGDCANILNALRPGFERGALKPFAVLERAVYPLDRAYDAYKTVFAGTDDRVILQP
jgi:NADPH:quinone reductase